MPDSINAMMYRSTINPEYLPQELRDLENWVCWKAVIRSSKTGEKISKVPFAPTGAPARSDDMRTWVAFTAALSGFERTPRFAGIGLQVGLLANEETGAAEFLSGIIGLDWDVEEGYAGPLDENGIPEAFAALIYALGSYVERSPSGRGFRVFCRGHLLPGYKAMNKNFAPGIEFEVYRAGRFLTVTTDVVRWAATGEQMYPVLRDAQADLDMILECYMQKEEPQVADDGDDTMHGCSELMSDKGIAELLQLARKTDPTFAALYDGGEHPTISGASEKDDSLCFKLVFWLHTPERVDAAFRASALMRPKWNRRDSGGTYGSRTITHALSNPARYTGRGAAAAELNLNPATVAESYTAVRPLIIDAITGINGSPAARASYKRLADSVVSMILEGQVEADVSCSVRLTAGGLEGLCALNGGDRSNLRERLQFLADRGLIGAVRMSEKRGHAYQVLMPVDARTLIGIREGLQPGTKFPLLTSSRRAAEKRAAQLAAGTLPARQPAMKAPPRPPTLHRTRYVADAAFARHTSTLAELISDTRESAGTARRCVRVLIEGKYLTCLPGHRLMAVSGAQGRFTLALAAEFEALRRYPAEQAARRAIRYCRQRLERHGEAEWYDRLQAAEARLTRLQAGESVRQSIAS